MHRSSKVKNETVYIEPTDWGCSQNGMARNVKDNNLKDNYYFLK